jgi:hypothetical protein
MRTSLNEIKRIDEYIFNNGTPGEALLFDAMLVLNPNLPEQVMWQKKTHAIIIEYSRKRLKAEIESVHNQLFVNPEHRTFRRRILSLFK